VEAPAVRISDLKSEEKGERSAVIRDRVVQCREIQENRFKDINVPTKTNANMSESLLNKFCKISAENMDLLSLAMERMSLSARAYARILKVSRTIADMAGVHDIEREHILEAIQYRSLDRSLH
jgi:magnesium chelatase family protein